MGLTQQEIAFGIATIGVESGFNPNAKAATTTAYGLGQFTDDTWSRAVNYYNSAYNKSLDAAASRSVPDAQIAVMGAWLDKTWNMAQSVQNDPRLSGFSIQDVAYGMWHEGFGTLGNIPIVAGYLHDAEFNNVNIRGYLNSTYRQGGDVLSGPTYGMGSNMWGPLKIAHVMAELIHGALWL